jgi:hypothetical protein
MESERSCYNIAPESIRPPPVSCWVTELLGFRWLVYLRLHDVPQEHLFTSPRRGLLFLPQGVSRLRHLILFTGVPFQKVVHPRV